VKPTRDPRHLLIVERDAATGEWSATHKRYLQSTFDFIEARHRRLLARSCQPNHVGNYRGKRTPRPSAPPLSPRERFARLQAHFLASQMTYRNPPTKRGAAPSSNRVAALSSLDRLIFNAT
jgi:hypothetical protein